MEKFISCDWGTSAFRLRLVEADTQNILAQIKTQQGIAATLAASKNEQNANQFSFYLTILSDGIAMLEKQYGKTLTNIPVVVSGMASSSIGMMELPYKKTPFKADGSDLLVKNIVSTLHFKHQILMISGVCSATDVMRGEETILAGSNAAKDDRESIFIFPGTHSKHVIVTNGIAADFKTYMTGEIFDLLVNKSILSASLQKAEGSYENEMDFYFNKGVLDGAAGNLLCNIFQVRVHQLFHQLDKKQNYHYLSGLLIGAELKDIPAKKYAIVHLISSDELVQQYVKALHATGITDVQYQQADAALVYGQSVICKQYYSTTKK